ncbi:5'-3' exoribonuclease 2 [Coemansia sp. RSA 1286]|nr:5'-3' exoribonuclease 2 [Coemansia sp. RSA 1721]KAJ2636671.1 5'-3' exoribonuclease 2 [Coemansia sp. RSA 1286]
MGVAAFYRWLTKKYPKVQSYVIEEKPYTLNGIEIPVDATKPNPNNVEFDNLYLDMNGVVHPCCHPQFREAPKTEEAMMLEVFKCLDRVFNLIRPRKIVYMALDGVAPRAKMNQQRSRRFRAAQEAEEKEVEQAKFAEEVFQATGERQPEPEKPWDSNCITPGTPFMELLAKSLRYYVVTKLNTDPAWRSVKVVLSDSNVPGEGEHKIMDYIRRQRMMPAHDPNTSHVLYGLDADLIMLSLATHEPHFKILREDVAWADMLSKPCRRCGKKGHFERSCLGKDVPTPEVDPNDQPFVFANIDVLREYLELELTPRAKLSFPFDLERAIDDWVFLCFFVGNDFLPHLPSLEIREGALEKLVQFWKDELPTSGGYITRDGDVDLFRVQPILDKIAQIEEATFVERKKEENRRDAQRNRGFGHGRYNQHQNNSAAVNPRAQNENAAAKAQSAANNFAAASMLKAKLVSKVDKQVSDGAAMTVDESQSKGEEEAEVEEEDEVMVSGSTTTTAAAAVKRAHSDDEADDDDDHKLRKTNDGEKVATDEAEPESEPAASVEASEATSVADDTETAGDDASDLPEDKVKFHEAGYKERYYWLKFEIPAGNKDEIHSIAEHYVRGLCWVLKYYYQGCASWSWYYPYHYAPLASDLMDLDMMDVSLELSAPLRPYEQLMGVLPARSRHNLPKPFSPLMTDKDSPIIDFYPKDFPLDLNGKKHLWQAVILLPFIDSKRLLDAVHTVYPQLDADETARNQRGCELLMVSAAHPLYESLCDLYATDDTQRQVPLDPRLSGRMSGTVSCNPSYIPHTGYESPLRDVGKPDVDEDRSISVIFHQPQPETTHTAVLLPGVQMPQRILTDADIEFVRTGGRTGYRGPPRSFHGENNRDFRDFYRQQGDDKYSDRGRGPRRYDQHGNVNQQYSNHYSGRHNQHQQHGPRPYGRPHQPRPARGHHHNHHNHHGNNNYSSRPPPPRPVGYQPFGGRPPRPNAPPYGHFNAPGQNGSRPHPPAPINAPTLSQYSGGQGHHNGGGQKYMPPRHQRQQRGGRR